MLVATPAFVSSIDFFFFQAEDGIRDVAVTGVQTCALPIFETLSGLLKEDGSARLPNGNIRSGGKSAVETFKGHQIPASIHYGDDASGSFDLGRFGLGCGDYPVGAIQRE